MIFVVAVLLVGGIYFLFAGGKEPNSWFSKSLSATEAKERLLEISRRHDGAFADCTESDVSCVESGDWPISMGDESMQGRHARGSISSETYAAYKVWRDAYVAEKKQSGEPPTVVKQPPQGQTGKIDLKAAEERFEAAQNHLNAALDKLEKATQAQKARQDRLIPNKDAGPTITAPPVYKNDPAMTLPPEIGMAVPPPAAGVVGTTRPEARPTGPANRPITANKWVPLFNGKDLTGWKADKQGQWKVEDGAIVSVPGPPARDRDRTFATSMLFTERNDYADFHLRAEFKINSKGDSGIFFRCGWPNTLDYEADISFYPDKMKRLLSRTGLLYKNGKVIAQPRQSLIRPDEWSSMEVIAEGRRIRVLVNGTLTADYTSDDDACAQGSIALQQWYSETVVRFRKIEIKELNSLN
jgi:hypothetical protein